MVLSRVVVFPETLATDAELTVAVYTYDIYILYVATFDAYEVIFFENDVFKSISLHTKYPQWIYGQTLSVQSLLLKFLSL